MKLNPTVRVEAEMLIDDLEAEVLEHVCSYDLAEWFASKCSHQFEAEYIKDVLYKIRQQARLVIEAREAALKEITRRGT